MTFHDFEHWGANFHLSIIYSDCNVCIMGSKDRHIKLKVKSVNLCQKCHRCSQYKSLLLFYQPKIQNRSRNMWQGCMDSQLIMLWFKKGGCWWLARLFTAK